MELLLQRLSLCSVLFQVPVLTFDVCISAVLSGIQLSILSSGFLE